MNPHASDNATSETQRRATSGLGQAYPPFAAADCSVCHGTGLVGVGDDGEACGRCDGGRRRPPFVYVAGPINGNPFGAAREVIPVWRRLRSLGIAPFCPQWSILPEMIESIDYETWLAYDFDIIRNCDAVIRLPGVSPGADREVAFAVSEVGIPIFWIGEETGWPKLDAWARTRTTPTPITSSQPEQHDEPSRPIADSPGAG